MHLSRRNFFKIAGVGVGSAAVGSATYGALNATGHLPTWLQQPVPPEARSHVWHALNRVTFGPRPGQISVVQRIGLPAFLEQQLNPESIDDSIVHGLVQGYLSLNMSAPELMQSSIDQQVIMDELDSMTLLRAVYSERQLYELMVNFWSEHFSILHSKDNCPYLKTIDDRDAIRPHALGNFRALLGASAQSPAMLDYLDNVVSDKNHPNENYARELLELHTLGVGNYKEQDVKEVARCFTGWTMGYDENAKQGTFVFAPDMHDNGRKTVLGHTIPAGGGITDGQRVLDILAAHPATAQRISLKLCRRFIGDNPSADVVKEVAQGFINNQGDIKAMLRTLFASQTFVSALPKFKRPFEYLVSLYRVLDIRISTSEALDGLNALRTLGHLPFQHPSPEGYSDLSERWIGNMLARWNVGLQVTYGRSYGTMVNMFHMHSGQSEKRTPHAFVDFYAQHMLGRTLTPHESKALWDLVAQSGTPDLHTSVGRTILSDAIALLATSPAYQFR